MFEFRKKYWFIGICVFSLASQTITAENAVTRGVISDNRGESIMLSPVGGYLDVDTHTKGKKGLQAYYDAALASGQDVPTAIHGELQNATELILDEMKIELNATEVLAMVMESHTGEMIAIASSNRYDPMHITQADVPNINPKFAEYAFAPGSVMKPVTLSLALDKGYVTPQTVFEGYNGKLKIGEKYTITDDEKVEKLTAADIIVHSSNIGISQVSLKLTGKEFREGLMAFGFDKKSGIDLARDVAGKLKEEEKLEHKLHRANTAYGYGMMATPMQLLKAYSVFANDGMMVTPHIAKVEKPASQSVISSKTASEMKVILESVVEKGTGKNAQTQGLSIGGKTGTAHIAQNGKYTNTYNSSFYGFAEDAKSHSYTIGVLVIDTKTPHAYFASQSAVPVFKKVVDVMVEEKLLIPELEKQSKEANAGNFTIYTDERVVNPLIGAKVVKLYGEYVDPEYDIKIFNESVTLQSSPSIKKVFNVMDGKVVFSGISKGLGNTVVMAHKDKLHTVYAGLSEIEPEVRVGEELGRAHLLGLVDETLVFQVTYDGKFIDPMKLIMSGEEDKKNYMQACDLNKDRKFFYKEEDIQNGAVSKQIVLEETECIKERLPNIVKNKELLEWLIKKGYFEKFVEHFMLPEGNSIIEELTCLYAKEKWNMDENHPEYLSYVEMCGDTKVFGDAK